MKKHFWKIFALSAIVLIGGAFAYSSHTSKLANEGVEILEHVKGNPEAEVVLTEYSDFQCPACQQFSSVIDDLLNRHEGLIRFEYKHFPLTNIHPHAVLAGRAAEAAGQQGEFFAMHDKLFENQSTWSQSPNPQAIFASYAEEIGLDMSLYRRHMRSSLLRQKVMDEFAEARDQGFTGTPSFLLNGEKFDYTTFEEFHAAIETAIYGAPLNAETIELDLGAMGIEGEAEAGDQPVELIIGSDESNETEAADGAFGFGN